MNVDQLPADEWGLAGGQRRAIDAMTRCGCVKLAAKDLGLGNTTVIESLKSVRQKMGVRFTALAMVKWDRFVREHSVG